MSRHAAADAELQRRIAELAESATPLVVVTLAETLGSTPADAGAKMIVTAAGLEAGTVGGGRVEAKAIDLAAEMLAGGGPATRLVDWRLKADVGMTCGGRVRLLFEALGVDRWPIVVFGAGHVTQALTRVLTTLDCRVTCVDPRADWLGRLPAGVATIRSDDPPAEVAALPDDAFVLCMTKGHRTDLPILEAIYGADRRFPYVGVIGSRAKAAVLRSELVAAGAAKERLTFHCPIGLPIGSNRPAEIAVSIAAQLLERRAAIAEGPPEPLAERGGS